MTRYAEKTQVPSDRSRAEIEKTLTRYGAESFFSGWDAGQAAIGFAMKGRQYRVVLPMPNRSSEDFTLTPTGKDRSASAAEAAYEQAVRQRWRALALMVKAKLEAVAAGIVTFEVEFLPHTVLPSGHTVAQDILPAVESAYASGDVARLQIGAGQCIIHLSDPECGDSFCGEPITLIEAAGDTRPVCQVCHRGTVKRVRRMVDEYRNETVDLRTPVTAEQVAQKVYNDDWEVLTRQEQGQVRRFLALIGVPVEGSQG